MKSEIENYMSKRLFNYKNIGTIFNFNLELYITHDYAILIFFGKDLMYHFIGFNRESKKNFVKEEFNKYELLSGDKFGFHLYYTNDFDKFISTIMDYTSIKKFPVIHDENHFVRMISLQSYYNTSLRSKIAKMYWTKNSKNIEDEQRKRYRRSKNILNVFLTDLTDSEEMEARDLAQSISSMLLLCGTITDVGTGKYYRYGTVTIEPQNVSQQLDILTETNNIWSKVFNIKRNYMFDYFTASASGIVFNQNIIVLPERLKDNKKYAPYYDYDEFDF